MELNFKSWLLLTERATSKRDKFVSLVGEVFGGFRTEYTNVLQGVVASVSHGVQQVNLTFLSDPARVQISFFFPDAKLRAEFGPPSEKDAAANERLVPGTLDMVRRIRRLIDRLGEEKIRVAYNPTDDRRERLYARLMNKGGWLPSDKAYKLGGKFNWNPPVRESGDLNTFVMDDQPDPGRREQWMNTKLPKSKTPMGRRVRRLFGKSE